MTVNFLGDSITEGACASVPAVKNYPYLVGKKLNIKTNNYGIGGTKIARVKEFAIDMIGEMDFNLRYFLVDKTADFTFVFGGTNDYCYGAPLGDVSDKTEYTFCGAVNILIARLKKDFGDRFAFIIPLKRIDMEEDFNGEHRKLTDYVSKLKTILNRENVRFLDLINEFPAPLSDKNEGYFADGLHPNDAGYDLLADKVVEFLKREKIVG